MVLNAFTKIIKNLFDSEEVTDSDSPTPKELNKVMATRTMNDVIVEIKADYDKDIEFKDAVFDDTQNNDGSIVID